MFVVQRTSQSNPLSGPTTVRSRSNSQSTGRGGTETKVSPPEKTENTAQTVKTSAAEVPTGLQKLLDTMSALGMNTAGLDITYSEEQVYYPGGTYMNRLINVTSNGKTEHFGSDLTAKNPLVTAYEIQRTFGVVPTASGASGGIRQV